MFPLNQLFSAFSFFGVVFAGVPLIWHLQAWNAGTCMYMIWTSLGCVVGFVDSIAWNEDASDKAPAWCDFAARFLVAGSVGIPASAFCMSRRLYYLTTSRDALRSSAQRQRDLAVDMSITLLIPLAVAAAGGFIASS
ncbi:fungal pheromone STE3G-protein-coupled receptor [Coniophora puteana RWD-64-598 SS2]|uniref:Fungal pheromone STE3G-protein-coupled receptor n=1 Tax=Coniophora puteana (strain RWD-64-598) TaxID=741705 RepID=A0A5M3MAE7_CONPW|nr:fungal pheromone STE3G-protein-coupled receptor [Coniophora puteana RWD-64-598 SS2]EIW76238.1 fungal pheromone STE3G-protein-coupled receptor [Coniophora puteana RWD-64-598 SS2]